MCHLLISEKKKLLCYKQNNTLRANNNGNINCGLCWAPSYHPIIFSSLLSILLLLGLFCNWMFSSLVTLLHFRLVLCISMAVSGFYFLHICSFLKNVNEDTNNPFLCLIIIHFKQLLH